jgi:5-formyltetrahydrofolate cyclo-ligase
MQHATTKAALRRQIRAIRAGVEDPIGRSDEIVKTLETLPGYRRAVTIAFYVNVRNEARTRGAIAAAIDQEKAACVPAVDGSQLKLYRVKSLAELSPGAFGVPEPSAAVRAEAERLVVPCEVDAFVVPGLAFDRNGGRLGYGRGYYDRLLATAPQAFKIGLAYDCQLVRLVPMAPTDVRVDCVVTESGVYAV